MNNSNQIRHSGIVETMDGELVKVRIIQSSACAACKVSKHCNASDSKEKIVDAVNENSINVAKGDKVVVVVSEENGFLAVLLSSVIPLIILLVALVLSMLITKDEAISGIICLCGLVPYFLLIYLFKNKIREKLSFKLESFQEDEQTALEEMNVENY